MAGVNWEFMVPMNVSAKMDIPEMALSAELSVNVKEDMGLNATFMLAVLKKVKTSTVASVRTGMKEMDIHVEREVGVANNLDRLVIKMQYVEIQRKVIDALVGLVMKAMALMCAMKSFVNDLPT